MLRRNADTADELAALLFAVLAFTISFSLLCGRALGRQLVGLLSRTFQRYGSTRVVRLWTVAAGAGCGLALLLALVTASAAAWLAALVVLPGLSLTALAAIESTLNHLSTLPPAEAQLPASEPWPDDEPSERGC